MKLNERTSSMVYFTIGKYTDENGKELTGLRNEVPEGTAGALRRDWQVGDKSGTKWELCYPSLEGKITDIDFDTEGDYGDQLKLTIDGEAVVSVKTSNKFGTKIMRLLPNVDLTKEVKIAPYSYVPNGKTNESTGVSIKQGVNFDEKISDHFYNFDKKETLHGLPVPDFEWTKETPEWQSKKFLSERDDFLQNYITEEVMPNIVPFKKEVVEQTVGTVDLKDVNAENDMVAGENVKAAEGLAIVYPKDDINPEDIPF